MEEETHDKIHDLVTPDDLDENTRVVLVNTLYFQGNWTTPFEPLFTKKATFHSPNDKTVETDTMFIESAEFNFYENEELDAKFLELPFVGEGASMTFVLPNKQDGIAILEKQTGDVLKTPEYKKEFVQVSLPKFKVEGAVEFKEILERVS